MTELRTLLRERLDHGAPVTAAEAQQTASNLRRGRSRRRWSLAAVTTSIVVVVATLVAVSAAGSSTARVVPVNALSSESTRSAPAVPGYDLTVSVVPDVTTVKAGTPIPVTVTLNNTSGHVLRYSGCGNFIEIGLTGPVVAIPLEAACLRSFEVPPGVSTSRQNLLTTWTTCTDAGAPGPDTPACDRMNPERPLPPLPAGRYHLVTTPQIVGVTFAPAPTITLY